MADSQDLLQNDNCVVPQPDLANTAFTTTTRSKKVQLGVVCSNSSARNLIIFCAIYFMQSTAGGIIIPQYAAYWFAGCIDSDSSVIIGEEDCNEDYRTYNLWNTIFWSITGFIAFLFSGFLGRVSDSFGRKPMILLCIISYALPRGILIFYVNLYLYFALSVFGDISSFAYSASFADIFTISQSLKTISYSLLYAMIGLGLLLGAIFSLIISYIWDEHTVFIGLGFIYIFLFMFWYFVIKETLSETLRKPFTSKHYNPFKPLLRINMNKIILYCSIIQSIGSFDQAVLFSIMLSFAGDQFDLKEGFQTNLVFAALGVIGGFGNVLQGFILMPIFKKYRYKNIDILIFGIIVRILGLYFIAISVLFYQHRIILSIIGAFVVGIGSIATPSNIGIASHYLSKSEQGVGLGIIDSYKAITKAIAPISMGMVYDTFSDKSINIPSMHWYIVILLRIIQLFIVLCPLQYALNQKDTEIASLDEDNMKIDKDRKTELVLSDNSYR